MNLTGLIPLTEPFPYPLPVRLKINPTVHYKTISLLMRNG